MPETQTHRPTEAQIHAAQTAGVDRLFLIVAATDPHAVGIEDNMPAAVLEQATDRDDPEPEEILARIDRGGDFIEALAEGDLARALYRSDVTNRRLLVRSIPEAVILAALARDRRGMESARTWFADCAAPYETDD